ncbi:hypothetical protein ACQ4PT_028729 [Festuca glaucescens]
MEAHRNPSMSASTMWTLGVMEGTVDSLLKVEIKYLPSPEDFVYALRVGNIPNVKWAVDEDGSMYMKFQDCLHSDFTAIHHFFVGGRIMLKFHKVVTVKYLDSLELNGIEISQEGTRVSVWTNAMVRKAISEDTKPDGTFGAARLKQEFQRIEGTSEEDTSRSHDFHYQHIESTSEGDQKDSSEQTSGFTDASKKNLSTGATANSHDPGTSQGSILKQIKQSPRKDGMKGVDEQAPTSRPCNDGFTNTPDDQKTMNGGTVKVDPLGPDDSKTNFSRVTNASSKHQVQQLDGMKGEQVKQTVLSDGMVLDPNKRNATTQAPPCLTNHQQQQDSIFAPEHSTITSVVPVLLICQGVAELKMKKVVGNEPGKSSNNNVPTSCSQVGQVSTQIDLTVQETSKPESLKSIIDNYVELKNKQQLVVLETPKQGNAGDIPCNDAGNQADGMQQLEVPDISDSEMPPYRRMDEIISNLTPLQNRSDGLTSLLDGTLPAECAKLLADMEPKPIPKKRKTVSFADEQMMKKIHVATTNSNSPSKYRTRALARQENISNSNNEVCTEGNLVAERAVLNAQVAPRRSPRKHPSPTDSAKMRMKRSSKLSIQANNVIDLEVPDVQHKQTSSGDDVVHAQNAAKPLPTNDSSPAATETMTRKLVFESTVSEKRERTIRMAPDPPSFELGTPPDDEQKHANANQVKAESKKTLGTTVHGNPECVVLGSTSVVKPGCNKVVEESSEAQNATAKTVCNVVGTAEAGKPGCSKLGTDQSASSITPVAREYEKRVVKQAKYTKPPFVNSEPPKTYIVGKSVETLYIMVCEHGWEKNPGDPDNGKTVIDVDDMFVNLGHLANSVAPRKQLVNIVAKVAISIIKKENKDPKKYIMPLRVSRYLITSWYDLKEICFPTLEGFTGAPPSQLGHYWLVNLNIKAQIFEMYDSLGGNGEALLMHACHLLIARIKTMWFKEYKKSKVQIADWPIVLIDSPKQNNGWDCGFFTLKNLEDGCIGRKQPPFSQKDLPAISKLYTDKWLRFNNKIQWQLFV